MKKTQKRVCGLLGLVLVVAMTIFAVFLPGPGAAATEVTSVTDTITVRVLDAVPSVTITNPASGELVSTLETPISLDYYNMASYTLTIKYVGDGSDDESDSESGDSEPEVIASVDTPDEIGSDTYSFRPYGKEHGYGKYIVTLTGVGLDGSAVEDAIEFEYVAVTASVDKNPNTGEISIDLDYDNTDEDLDDDEKVASVKIEILDENGNPVPGLSPIVVNPITTPVKIPFEEYGLPSGTYTAVITPYNASGEELYRTIILTIDYEEPIVVPDTGSVYKGLNISSTDYLITGLLVFLVVGIGGLIFISKRDKKTVRRRK